MGDYDRRAGYGSKSPHATLSDAAYEARVYQSKPRLEARACPWSGDGFSNSHTEISQFFLNSCFCDHYARILGGVEFKLNGGAL